MSKELDVAKETILKAGKLIMDFYTKQNFSVENKEGFENFVTDADKDAEDLIKAELMKHFPDHGFRAEEIANDPSDKEFVWIVDPLDGTRNFVKRKGEFAVHIGLAYKGESILGVVYVPTRNRLYFAEKGKGAFCNNEPIKVSNNNMNNIRGVTTSSSTYYEELIVVNNKIPYKELAIRGSAGHKFCLVAEGVAEIFITPKNFLKEWDFCAPAIILKEAGGKITTFDGKELIFNRKKLDYDQGVLGSNSIIHEELLSLINS
ncbi:hypothetical protein H8D36_01095 [archaeon]|nr:hypothetical protein [archaeon]